MAVTRRPWSWSTWPAVAAALGVAVALVVAAELLVAYATRTLVLAG